MDKDLEFCLLKFTEEQQLLHDNERQTQEKAYEMSLAEIKAKEKKLSYEQQMMIEHFQKELMLYKQKIDDSKAQVEYEIKISLQKHIDSQEEYAKQTIHATEKEFDIWVEGKQHERSKISDENELSKFDQTFGTEKAYKMKELNDLRHAKYEQLKIERESLNDNVQEIHRIITNSNDEKYWVKDVRTWCDEKFRFIKSEEGLSGDRMATDNANTPSKGFLSEQTIQRISSTKLDNDKRKQKLIAEFKEKIEKILQDKQIEFDKEIDEQIQRLNRQTNPTFDTTTINTTTVQPRSLFSKMESMSTTLVDTESEGLTTEPTYGGTSSASDIAVRQNPKVISLEFQKREHSERLQKDYEEIISILESSDIDDIPLIIQKWLNKQSYERSKRFEKYRQEYEEKQARYQAMDQAKMIGLNCALNELAINSQSADRFKQKLKQEEELMMEKHRELKSLQMKISVPVIVQQINDPKVHKLSVCIRFNEDFDEWMQDIDKHKVRLISSIQQNFNLPENAFEIIRIEPGSIVVHANINPPHGHHFFQQVMADGIANIAGYDTISITFGELNLNIEQEKMNARYNRTYGNGTGDTHWTGSLDRGGKPYFCPEGWRRFGIKVANTKEEFDQQWGNWHIAYHGTASINASAILTSGLRTNLGCYAGANPVVYLSPSINYSAHYRYANPWKNPEKPGKYYQMVFQCRVNPQMVTPDKVKPQTLQCPQTVRIDEHFTNNEMEWIIYPTNNERFITDNIICYGIMIRVCDRDPYDLPESQWWRHTPYPRTYV